MGSIPELESGGYDAVEEVTVLVTGFGVSKEQYYLVLTVHLPQFR